MTSEMKERIVNLVQAFDDPSSVEFEMAYQARVAIDFIKSAISHSEQFSKPSDQMREASLCLLEALDRLEGMDRRFQLRSRGHDRRTGNDQGGAR